MQAVYERTQNGLAKEELIFANKLVKCQEYHEDSDAAYWRKPSMNLDSEIQEILTKSGGKLPREINLYCDTFHLVPASTINATEDDLDLTIYAREFIVTPAEGDALITINAPNTASVGIYTPSIPEKLKFQFKIAGESRAPVAPHTQSGRTGFRVDSENTVEPRETLDVVFTDHLDGITPEGTMSTSAQWHDDNLARLLHFQFLCATSNYRQNPAAARKLLSYIYSMTTDIGLEDINDQASKLLMHISAQSNRLVPYIPPVSLASSRALLDSRLAAASAFETNFYRFIELKSDSGHLGEAVNLMASASSNTADIYTKKLETAKSRYDDAQAAYATAMSRFTSVNSSLDSAGEKFKTGMQTWAREKRQQAFQEVGFAVVEVAGAIGICIATGGATAPTVGATVVKAAGTASKLGEIFKKLKAFYDRFELAVTKIQEMIKTTKKTLETLETVKEVKELRGIVLPPKSNIDEVNGIAEWDIFIQQVQAMFEELRKHSIDGKKEYKAALLELAILGKATLASGTRIISTGQDLAVMELQEKLAKSHRGTVKACLGTIDGDARIFEKLKLFMFDHLMAVRRSVYMDFSLYAMAYTYHSLSTDVRIKLSATKSVADYHSDAAMLQEDVVKFNSTINVQQKSFVLTMTEDREAIKQALCDAGSYSFALNHAHTDFNEFYRIRVEEVRCYLTGVTANDNGTIELLLRTGRKFEDKNILHEACPFFGRSQKWVFGYKVGINKPTSTRSLHGMDGAIKFPPFTNWAVKVHGDPDRLDFSGFTGMKLEFWCEAVLGSKPVTVT